MPKVLITGGAGFIGSNVYDRFRAAGYSIVVVDDLSSGTRSNLPADADVRVHDVTSAETAALIETGGFDVVAHLAAQIDVRKSVSRPAFDAQINIGGMLNILEAIGGLDRDKRPRLIFASTGGALYGDAASLPTVETAPTNPDAPYGIAKLACEFYMAYYARIWGLETTVLRFGNVYGPRQDPHGDAGVIAIFCGRLLSAQPLTIFGTGEQTRDYVFVSDVAEAFYIAATYDIPPAGPVDARAFNIGTCVETSVLDVARILTRAAARPESIAFAPERRGEVARSLLGTAKAESILGWKARVAIEDGLTRTLEWARSNGRSVGANPGLHEKA
jgi:UDP-glucose 4-epimerase